MFVFRVTCSAVALLALVLAAPVLRVERPVEGPAEGQRIPADVPISSPILRPPPDCASLWNPPLPFLPAP